MQQLQGNQQASNSTNQFPGTRSNSMYNITKPDGSSLPTPKQPFIANNISFGRETQAISYKAKPCILSQQQPIQTETYKSISTPSSIIGALASNSTSKSINNSAQKISSQFSIAQTTGQGYQQNFQASSSNGFSLNSQNGPQQISYQYNSSRNRQLSHIYSSNTQNMIIHSIGDIAHKVGVTSINFEKKLSSVQQKENNENCLGIQIQNSKQPISQLGPTLISHKMIPSSIPFIQSPLKTSLQSSGKKTDKHQILSQNQNVQNAVSQGQQLNNIQQQQAVQKTQEKEVAKENNQQLLKESSIKFITNTDLETELKDLAHLLKRDRDIFGSNILLATDREQVIPEMKMEIELLKEQNEALKIKVEELTFCQNDKKENTYDEQNQNLKQTNHFEYQQLTEKYSSIEKAYDLMRVEYDSLNQKYLELQSQRNPTGDMENVNLVYELEQKVLYMEEKMREDEIQSNQMKLVVLRQEESITLLENMVREAREAQQNAEKQLTDQQSNRSQKDTQISERYECQKTEIVLLNNKIEMLKLDADRALQEKQNLDKLMTEMRVQHEEQIKEVKAQLKKKIKELKKTKQNLEKEISNKDANLQQIESEGVLLSKNTNALSDKVIQLQSLLEKKVEELKEMDKTLMEEQNKTQQISEELQVQHQSYEATINQLQNQNKSIQEQLTRKNILLDSASVSFEVNQKCLMKEKEDALDKITKQNEEISQLKKGLEEQQELYDKLQEKFNDFRQQNESMLQQNDKLRNENLDQMRIFQDTQKALNNRIDQLIQENNKLQQLELLNLNERTEQFNLMFQQLQQEKLQLIQDNSIIVQDKITLSEKVRELQQNNIDLLSKTHSFDNQKKNEIIELKFEVEQLTTSRDQLKQENSQLQSEIQEYKKNINSYKEQINSFIVDINQFQLQLDTLKQESRLKTEQINQQENLILNQKNQIDTFIEKSYLDQETERQVESKIKELEDEKIEVNMKYENISKSLREAEEEIRQVTGQLNQKAEQISILENYKDVLTKEKEQQLIEINKYHFQINKLSSQVKEGEQKIKIVEEKYNEMETQLNSAQDLIFNIKQQYSQELIERDQLILQYKEKLRCQNMNQIEQSQILQEMNNEIEKQKNLEQQVSVLRKEKEKLELEQIKLLKDNEVLRLHLIQKQPENCQIEQILQEHNQILNEYHEEIQRLKEKLQQKNQILEKFTNKISIQQDKIAENEKDISNLQTYITNGKKHYEKLIEEYQLKMDQMQQQNTQQQIVLNNQIHLLMQDKQQMKSHLDQIQKEMSEITQLSLKMSQFPQKQ